jgi:CRISPR-associated endonuclease/helicase Cas3
MGRCYRRPAADGTGYGDVVLYRPESASPYEPEELRQGHAFAAELAGRHLPISQGELAQMLEQLEALRPAATDGYAGFLDSGLLASSREQPFRDVDEFTMDAVLDSDIEEWRRMTDRRDPAARGFILPAPRRLLRADARLRSQLQAAPSSHYSARTGLHNEEIVHAQ